MSNAISRALLDISVESGEVGQDPTSFHQDLNEMLMNEQQVAQEPSITDKVQEAQRADSVTDQLDELATRAEEVSQIEDPAVAQVAVESLHREFRCIMRANDLPFQASSFESTYVVSDQATGLAKDARRVAAMATQVSRDLRGYSEEAGELMAFFRRDKSRLEEAERVLAKAIPAIQRIEHRLAEQPVHVNHNGVGRFMTVAGEAVLNMPHAVGQESAQMHKLHEGVMQGLAAFDEIVQHFKSHPNDSFESVATESKFSQLNALIGIHHHMGNFAITVIKDPKQPVPTVKRINENSFQKGNFVRSYMWSGMAAIGWTAATIGLLTIGGLVTGGLTTALAATKVGAIGMYANVAYQSAKSGVNNYHNNANETEAKSVASAGDFMKSLQQLDTIGKMTKLNDSNFERIFKYMDDALHNSLPKHVYGQLEDLFDNLQTAIDVIYEQAIYDVVEGAKLAGIVTSHYH